MVRPELHDLYSLFGERGEREMSPPPPLLSGWASIFLCWGAEGQLTQGLPRPANSLGYFYGLSWQKLSTKGHVKSHALH